MTVAEAIELFKTFPQDARLIHTICSDYEELEVADFTLFDGKVEFERDGKGLIRHKGHLMLLKKEWVPAHHGCGRPVDPEFVTAVHIRGN